MRRNREGRGHGASMIAPLFFADVFEPRQVAGIEHVARQNRLGAEAGRIACAATASPGRG